MDDEWKAMIAIIALGIILLFLVWIVSIPLGWIGCSTKYSDSDIPHKYSIINGCMLKSDKWGWVPEDKFWSGDKHITVD